jgi:hypothetical protein
MSDPARNPIELSVLVFMPHHHSWLEPLLRALRAQTVAQNIELIVAVMSRSEFNAGEEVLRGFGRSILVETPHAKSFIAAKIEGLRVATAPIVAFAEDHCFPEPTWAERLLAAHAGDCVAVGPRMSNANPATAMSRSLFSMHWGRWADDIPARDMDCLPPHNTSYKRPLLMAHIAELEEMFPVEALFHAKLRELGFTLRLEPGAVVRHCNISKLEQWCKSSYHGGRLYGSMRVRYEHDTTARRLFRGFISPLVPFVRLRREASMMWSTGGSVIDRVCTVMMAFVGLCFHSAGEAAGYVAGEGDAGSACADIETSRFRDMREGDLLSLRSASSRHGLEPALMS